MHQSTLLRLNALEIEPSADILAVDADEVIVHWARDFAVWAARDGFHFDMRHHRLEDALSHSDGVDVTTDVIDDLASRFVAEVTETQSPTPGAVDTLTRLQDRFEIVVLTNVPLWAWQARETNMAALGLDVPVIANEGGKGPALAQLAGRTSGQTVFIDDSPFQIASAAQTAPQVTRLHFAGCELMRAALPHEPLAHHSPQSWAEVEDIVTQTVSNSG